VIKIIKRKIYIFIIIAIIITLTTIYATRQPKRIDIQTLESGITIYDINASIKGRWDNKIYLDLHPIPTEFIELDTITGNIETYPTKGLSLVTINENYLAGCNNNLEVYDRKNKNLLWKLPYNDVMLHVDITLNDNFIYFAPNHQVMKINIKNGDILWSYELNNGFDHLPIIYEFSTQVVYFGEQQTFIFDKDNGTLLDKPEPINNPFIFNEKIYYARKGVIKEYSIDTFETKIIESDYYADDIIHINNNNMIYSSLSNDRDLSIITYNDDEKDFNIINTPDIELKNVIQLYPYENYSNNVSIFYYKNYLLMVDKGGSLWAYNLNSDNTSWVKYDLYSVTEEKEQSFTTSSLMLINNYIYYNNGGKLIEINLDEFLK